MNNFVMLIVLATCSKFKTDKPLTIEHLQD